MSNSKIALLATIVTILKKFVLLTTCFRCNPKGSPTLLVAKSVSLIVQKMVKSIGETKKF